MRKTHIMLWVCLSLIMLNIVRFYLISNEQVLIDTETKLKHEEVDADTYSHSEFTARNDSRISEKPLFEKNRQPFVVQAKSPENKPLEPQMVSSQPQIKFNPKLPELLGVLNIDTQTYAFFNGGDEQPDVVGVGGVVNEWTVKGITTQEVTLVYQENEEILKIKWNQHISMAESDKLLLNDSGEDTLEKQGSLKDRLSRIIKQ